jgi:signal transduction histidine kinase
VNSAYEYAILGIKYGETGKEGAALLPMQKNQESPAARRRKLCHCSGTTFCQIHTFPLSLLGLSVKKRLLIVLLSYGVGIPGIWFFFPHLHNAASMILPIISLCWLFSYRGLVISLFSTAATIWVVYYFFAGDTLPIQVILQRTVLGLGIMLLLSLTICWLRTAIDIASKARQQALTADQERLLAIERERQISISYEQQRTINALKDQFLLNVSHELRTPITVLGGYLELFKEYHELLDPLERTRMLAQALASHEALADFVNRVLDTNIVASEIPVAKPETICVHQLLHEVLAHLKASDVEAYTICLHVPEQVIVWADPHLLGHVLYNLLSNIFKYVPTGTNVHIETTQATPTSPVCLSIQDAGIGIPPDELPLLFEKFVRLKRDLAGTTRGTGLGLYICKRLVEGMKGSIWVESSGRSGEGCRFCVTLPSFPPP